MKNPVTVFCLRSENGGMEIKGFGLSVGVASGGWVRTM